MPKKRNFAFLLYPESCSSEWQQILRDLGQPVMWILHDKDTTVNESGEVVPKKPHYHVMIMYNTPHSDNTARQISLMCGGNGHLETVVSKRGYVRYLTHKDDEFKHHYDDSEVVCYGGADYAKLSATDAEALTKSNDLLAELLTFIKSNHIIAYCVVVDYCITERRDWLELLRGRSGQLVSDYIKSRYWLNQYE